MWPEVAMSNQNMSHLFESFEEVIFYGLEIVNGWMCGVKKKKFISRKALKYIDWVALSLYHDILGKSRRIGSTSFACLIVPIKWVNRRVCNLDNYLFLIRGDWSVDVLFFSRSFRGTKDRELQLPFFAFDHQQWLRLLFGEHSLPHWKHQYRLERVDTHLFWHIWRRSLTIDLLSLSLLLLSLLPLIPSKSSHSVMTSIKQTPS